MAERSFAREDQDLRLGDGDEFRREGILAIAKALLQSGVAYVGGSPCVGKIQISVLTNLMFKNVR
jgi:hypothetical protein